MGNATSYVLNVNTASNPLQGTPKFAGNVGLTTTFMDTGYADNGAAYNWWVWAVNSAGQSPWADVLANGSSFSNGAPPPASV